MALRVGCVGLSCLKGAEREGDCVSGLRAGDADLSPLASGGREQGSFLSGEELVTGARLTTDLELVRTRGI